MSKVTKSHFTARVQLVFAANSPTTARPSRSARSFCAWPVWAKTTCPGSPRGGWAEPGRGRGPRGGIVSARGARPSARRGAGAEVVARLRPGEGGRRAGARERPRTPAGAAGAPCRSAPGALQTPREAQRPGRRRGDGEHESSRGPAGLGALLGRGVRGTLAGTRQRAGAERPGLWAFRTPTRGARSQPRLPARSRHGQRGEHGLAADRFQGAQRAIEAADARAR